jgi:catalase-peroxidase
LENPLAAVQMGRVDVNLKGPAGESDLLGSARDVCGTFARMAMNGYETAALAYGGHTFGKCHGAGPASQVGAAAEGAPIEQHGLGWISSFGSGMGGDQIGSGLEGSWTPTPTQGDMRYLDRLFDHEWVLSQRPASARQWTKVTILDRFDLACARRNVCWRTDTQTDPCETDL